MSHIPAVVAAAAAVVWAAVGAAVEAAVALVGAAERTAAGAAVEDAAALVPQVCWHFNLTVVGILALLTN